MRPPSVSAIYQTPRGENSLRLRVRRPHLRAVMIGSLPVRPHRVVVLGGGFGGLQAALALRRGPLGDAG